MWIDYASDTIADTEADADRHRNTDWIRMSYSCGHGGKCEHRIRTRIGYACDSTVDTDSDADTDTNTETNAIQISTLGRCGHAHGHGHGHGLDTAVKQRWIWIQTRIQVCTRI